MTDEPVFSSVVHRKERKQMYTFDTNQVVAAATFYYIAAVLREVYTFYGYKIFEN